MLPSIQRESDGVFGHAIARLTSSRATCACKVGGDLAGQPHVRNSRASILVEHHVFWLEISIDDALLMEMTNSQHSPRRVVLRHDRRKNTKLLEMKPQITCMLEAKGGQYKGVSILRRRFAHAHLRTHGQRCSNARDYCKIPSTKIEEIGGSHPAFT